VLATSGGRLLRFIIDDENLPVMGRGPGPQALRMGKTDHSWWVVAVLSGHDCVLMVSAAGFAKRLPVESPALGKRGDIGTQAFQFSQKNRPWLVDDGHALRRRYYSPVTSADRIATVCPMESVPRQGRTGHLRSPHQTAEGKPSPRFAVTSGSRS
jgi:DNA gyrase subunit A